MLLNARGTVVVVFVLTTILFSAFTAYSAYSYFQLYHAVRTFSVSTTSFSFNAMGSILKTELNIQNPSEVPFEILYVEERIEADYNYILNTGVYRQNDPLQLPPQGNLTITISSIVPDNKISEVTAGLDKNWFLTIRFRIQGPIVSKFHIERWFTTQITSV